jgi:hypothetical protein
LVKRDPHRSTRRWLGSSSGHGDVEQEATVRNHRPLALVSLLAVLAVAAATYSS